MKTTRQLATAGLLLPLVFSASAQIPLTLAEAVQKGLRQHPSIQAAQSGVDAAATRLDQAASGMLPKANFTESWQRSNNPVFVFSSLLTQREFSQSNFAIEALIRPSAVNNFQSVIAVDQPIYDAGLTRQARKSADLGRAVAEEDKRRAEMDLIARITGAYYGAQLAANLEQVAATAVRSAEADLERARAVREAGMSTDADVLSIEVHLAQMREQQIARRSDAAVARAALNEAMGEALDARYALATPLPAADVVVERTSMNNAAANVDARPEVRQAQLGIQLAEAQTASARAAYLPQVSARAAFEADRQRFVTRAGANWFAGVTLRWNLFNGFADRAKIAEASTAITRARAMERQAEQGAQLQIRRATAALESAGERVGVSSKAVAQAEESLRITKDRYEAGLATVTDLLRTEAALAEAQSRREAAVHDRRLAEVALEYATGTLTENSELLK